MIDIGINLTNQRFDKDRTEVISRAKNANVNTLIVTGTSIEESVKALSLCKQFESQFPKMLFCTAGVHPHDADHVPQHYLEKLTELSKHHHVKAIGECGLDFNRNFSAPEQQKKIFKEQIQLAAELQMPLFLHQRDAFEPWFEALKPYFDQVPAMISHCFTGSKEELMQCISADMYIGITGWLCDERRGQALREIVHLIPKHRLLIETDGPYLTPRTIRPKPKSSRNEPAYLPYVLQELASIIGLDEAELAQQTSLNAKRAFSLESL